MNKKLKELNRIVSETAKELEKENSIGILYLSVQKTKKSSAHSGCCIGSNNTLFNSIKHICMEDSQILDTILDAVLKAKVETELNKLRGNVK